MVAFSKIALVAVSAAGAMASTPAPYLSPLAVFHDLPKVPSQWTSHGQADSQATIRAQIGLKQKNVKGLQAKLLDISNPSSENYGKWLSKEEIDAFTAPPAEHVAAVKAWLAAHGITEVEQPTNDWISFAVPVSKMEKLLNAKYEWFSHMDKGIENAVPRTMKFSVPEALHEMIDLVTPTTAFYTNASPSVDENKTEASLDKRAGCPSSITPSCINQLYNVDYTSKGSSLVATTGMLGYPASHSDFSQFSRTYTSGLKDFKDVSVGNGRNSGGSSNNDILLEGNLDTQYAGGLSSPNPSQFLACGPNGQDFTDQVANLASYLTSTNTPPSAVSTSYLGEEQGFSSSYLDRVCNEFMKAGSRGISVFFASGDYGVAGTGEQSCNNGFIAAWPAACPWVTAVGGTQFNGNTEVVADFRPTLTSPGGGYSNHFSAPDYNKADTSAYSTNHGSNNRGYYNPSGRGYPDISLVSLGFQTVINGGTESVRGTSAASPSWAGLVSVLNDYRNSQGKPNLGFINPLLYSSQGKSALRDVTSGNNYGCGMHGFDAAQGWDPATGLGSLDFGKLRSVI